MKHLILLTTLISSFALANIDSALNKTPRTKAGTASKASPTQIIGRDERFQLSAADATKDLFYSTVGQIVISSPGSKTSWLCTGTLITRQHVLTNGHCLTKDKKGGFIDPTHLTFSPGRLRDLENPKGSFKGTVVNTFRKWIVNEDERYDVAVVKLDRDTGIDPQVTLKVTYGDLGDLWKSNIYITGYPGDKSMGTMWEGEGAIVYRWDDKMFHHDVDTMGGMSGSVVRRRKQGKWEVIGVHRGLNNIIMKTNKAVLITAEVMEAINKWTKK